MIILDVLKNGQIQYRLQIDNNDILQGEIPGYLQPTAQNFMSRPGRTLEQYMDRQLRSLSNAVGLETGNGFILVDPSADPQPGGGISPDLAPDDRTDAVGYTQDEVNYNNEDNGAPCENCVYWQGYSGETDEDDHDLGLCQLVEGDIWGLASCDLWEQNEPTSRDDSDRGLQPKKIRDKNGHDRTVYVRPMSNEDPNAPHWMVFFKGRNTSTVVKAKTRGEAIKRARGKKVAGHDQPVVKAHKAEGKDLEDIRKGKWVRTRPSGQRVHGKAPKDESPSTFRPWYKKDAADPDLPDLVIESLERRTAPLIKAWSGEILDWIKSFDSLEAVKGAFADVESLWKKLGGSEFERQLYESMMLSDLGGRLEVLDEDAEMDEGDSDSHIDSENRQDAPKPEWLKLPFREAIDWFRKKVPIPVDSYKQMDDSYHDWAFSISGLTRGSLLNDAQWLVDKAIADGDSLDTFSRQWDRLIGRQGWQPSGNKDRRIYTIFDTNIRSAYGAGRGQQMYDPDVVSRRPYIVWRWRDSPNPRVNHQALNDKAIASDSPFWQKCAFPAGWGCRCGGFAVSKSYLERNDLELLTNPPDPETIAEPGFRRPLQGLTEQARQEAIAATLKNLSPEVRAVVEKDLDAKP